MPQNEPHKTKIGDHDFVMYMLPPRKSHKLLQKVIKNVGPSIGMFFDGMKGGDVANVMDKDVALSPIVSKIIDDLDDDLLDVLMDEFAEITHVDGGLLKAQFDIFFMGNLDLMYLWLFWGAKVQWEKSLRALVGKIIPAAQ